MPPAPRRSGSMDTDRKGALGPMVTIQDVRAWAMTLPRTEEYLLRDHVKFRVGRIVYATVSPDETTMGVGFPREERAALVAAEPDNFSLPRSSDMRYQWVHARMAALTLDEMRELVTDAWCMVVSQRAAAAHLDPSRPAADDHRPRSKTTKSRPGPS
jgi:hypothetical protein